VLHCGAARAAGRPQVNVFASSRVMFLLALLRADGGGAVLLAEASSVKMALALPICLPSTANRLR